MSSDLYNQIINDRGSLPRILNVIPGFEGYMDRTARRTADRLLRDHLASQIDQRIKRLARIEKQILDKPGGLALMPKTGSAKTKLQTYHDRIIGAAPGYSGFFESIKIDSEELDLLYGFDELQIVYADKLDGALDTLEQAVSAGQGIEDAIRALDNLTVEANDAFSKRESTLLSLGTAAS